MKVIRLFFLGTVLFLIAACKDSSMNSNINDNSGGIDKLYVGNTGDQTVSVISISKNEVIKTVQVGFSPSAIAACADLKIAYLVGGDSKNVAIMNTNRDEIQKMTSIPGYPLHVVAGDSDWAYMIVDPDTNVFTDQYIGRINSKGIYEDSLYFEDACAGLRHLAYGKRGFLYGAAEIILTCDAIPRRPFIVDLNNRIRVCGNTIPARILKLSFDEKLLYLIGKDYITKFNAEAKEIINYEKAPKLFTALSLSSNGQKAYLANATLNYIFILNLNTLMIEDSIKVNSPVYDMVVTADDQFIYASHPRTNQISVINLKTKHVEKEIDVGKKPKSIVLISQSF